MVNRVRSLAFPTHSNSSWFPGFRLSKPDPCAFFAMLIASFALNALERYGVSGARKPSVSAGTVTIITTTFSIRRVINPRVAEPTFEVSA
jgi:hypothetical protein